MKIAQHLLILLLFAVFSYGEEQLPNVASVFKTSENVGIVISPEWVELRILKPKKPWFSRKHPTKYREGKSVKLSSSDAALLTAKLTDEKTYDWTLAKACMPTYNARARFHRAGHTIDADFCFGCDILLLQKDGQALNFGYFDAASDEIFAIVRSHFPRDPVVQAVEKSKKEREKIRAQIQEAVRLEKEKARQQATTENPSAAP